MFPSPNRAPTMERNAFLPRGYQLFDQHTLLAEIDELGDILTCLPNNEALASLRQEAEQARQALFDELRRRKAPLGTSMPLTAAPPIRVNA